MAETKINKYERNFFIDIVKATAIFLMLWGHCIQYCIPSDRDFFLDNAFKTIYSFHMPLLMLVSGFLFYVSAKRSDKSTLLNKKIHSLIKPILGGSLFVFIFSVIPFSFRRNNYLIIFNGKWMDSLESLWFLWSVLSASIVFCLIEKYANKWYKEILLVITGLCFVAVFPNAEMNLFMYSIFLYWILLFAE